MDHGDEGCLVFALCVDFFNVKGMLIWGASVSCGIIALICLNLPYSIHYKFENMYIAGLIPEEPPDIMINHYVQPLLEDLVYS